MHGYSLSNCDYYADNNYMHPLIKKAYIFLRTFGENKFIVFNYTVLNLDFEFIIFCELNHHGDKEYRINVLCQSKHISQSITTSNDRTEPYHELLALKPVSIKLGNIVNNKFEIRNRVDITDKILCLNDIQ